MTYVSLEIDLKEAVRRIKAYIQEQVNQHSAKGVLIGLSGGLDSAVLATLAVRALGKEKVHLAFLYDRDSKKESMRNARLVADWLGVELEVENIEPALRRKQIYAPLAMRLSVLSGFLNRLLYKAYGWIFGETPFISTLRQGKFDGDKLKKFIYDYALCPIEAGFNQRHIYRRQLLKEKAEAHNLILPGAANQSEYLTGWFVKAGIDDMPFSPLKDLYKTQIRELASYLALPPEIQNQLPSPDMMKGVDDEFALGISYSKLDIILAGIERGLSDEEIISAGITQKELSLVRKMNRLSEWKRSA